jgi:hypothetical protein
MKKSNIRWIITAYIVIIGIIIYIANTNHSELSQKPRITETDYREFDENENNVESSIANDNFHTNSFDKMRLHKILRDCLELYRSNKSQYKGSQLKDGSSPFDACFGKGVYSGNATLTIKNGSSSDAIVCLYSISKKRTIRNEYVCKNSDFTMDNIAQGYYKIRVLHGNNWNPTLENFCGIKGNFESDLSFSEFDGQQYFEDNYDAYTVATITLYTVVGGNASTSKISQSEFFSN